MGRVKAGSLRLKEAAELLGLSYRQAKRVWARYRGGGAKALQHGNCGRISNRAHPEEFRQAVLVQVRSVMRTSDRRWRRNTWRKKTDSKWPPRPCGAG